MKIEKFDVGQVFYEACLTRYGDPIENSGHIHAYTTFEEAKADGEERMKLCSGEHPFAITIGFLVETWEVDAVDINGNITIAHTGVIKND